MNGNGLSSLELSPFRLMPSWGCSSGGFRNQHVRNWRSPGAEGAAALQSQACLILEHSLSCMPWCLMLKQMHSFLPLLIPISTEHPCLIILFLGKPDHADVPCKEWFHITKLSKHSIFYPWGLHTNSMPADLLCSRAKGERRKSRGRVDREQVADTCWKEGGQGVELQKGEMGLEWWGQFPSWMHLSSVFINMFVFKFFPLSDFTSSITSQVCDDYF